MSFLIDVPELRSAPVHRLPLRRGGAARRPTRRVEPSDEVRRLWMRRNVAGEQAERWFHRDGCRRWLTITRNTVTNQCRWHDGDVRVLRGRRRRSRSTPATRSRSALYRAGVRTVSRSFKYHRRRGFLCMSGDCPNCLVQVDGEPGVRCLHSCRARDGMKHRAARTPGLRSTATCSRSTT